VHFRWRSSRGRQARLAWASSLLIVTASIASRAEPHSAIELEPVTFWVSTGDVGRTTVSVLGYTYGNRFGHWIPYFGGGLGFFTVQARGGVTWLPGDVDYSGLMVRLEARPQLLLNPCFEPLIVGNLGAGYRWPLERGDPGYPGTAIYLLPQFTGGVGFLHGNCGQPTQTPLHDKSLLGATLSGGFDW
jgi:hypothetical protein